MRINLKIFRLKQHLTQNEMCERLNCSRATYAAIENGARTGRLKFWNTLQDTFGLSGDEMWELMKNEQTEH